MTQYSHLWKEDQPAEPELGLLFTRSRETLSGWPSSFYSSPRHRQALETRSKRGKAKQKQGCLFSKIKWNLSRDDKPERSFAQLGKSVRRTRSHYKDERSPVSPRKFAFPTAAGATTTTTKSAGLLVTALPRDDLCWFDEGQQQQWQQRGCCCGTTGASVATTSAAGANAITFCA